jgi:hypothetical protein
MSTGGNYTVYQFKEFKVNKHSTIYQLIHNPIETNIITELIRIEKFQGYSNAYNLTEYFRIRNTTNWHTSKQVTGLFKTQANEIYYGDTGRNSDKSLLMFKFKNNRALLDIYLFNSGFYPHPNKIEDIAKTL